jgi:O-antigen/teichoic acid export membrane protein
MSRSVLKNTMYLNIKAAVTTIVSLFTTRIILNALGASDFGVFGTVAGSVAMLAMLNSALTVSTQRFMNFAIGKNDEQEQKLVFNNSMVLHIGLGLVIVLLMEIMYRFLFSGVLTISEDRIEVAKILYHLMCISTFFSIITVPFDALINAHEDFLYYSIVGIVESFLKLTTALLIVRIASDRLFIYGFLLTLISISMMVIMQIYCKRKYAECVFRPKFYFNEYLLKEISAFAGWRFVGVFANFFGNYGSNILMNHFFGTIMIAAKNIGDQAGGQLYLVSSNMMRAFNPVIIKAESKGDTKHMLCLSMQSCRFGYLLYLVVAIPFIVSMSFVLELWLKNVPNLAVLFCQLQILRILLEQLSTPMYTSLIAKGNLRDVSICDFILGVATFFMLWFCYYNGSGAEFHYYISILLMVIISMVMKLYLCKKICGLSILEFNREVVIPCCLVTIVLFLICYSVSLAFSPVWTMLINIALSIVGIFYMGLKKGERGRILGFVVNKGKLIFDL